MKNHIVHIQKIDDYGRVERTSGLSVAMFESRMVPSSEQTWQWETPSVVPNVLNKIQKIFNEWMPII